MARIRSIKPDFFTSEDVASLPLRPRLTWIGLWTHSDDHGRAKDDARLIKAAVWPLDDDVTVDDVGEDLDVLAAQGRILRYAVAGKRYLAVRNWHLHQAINKPTASQHPAPAEPTSQAEPGQRGYCPQCAGGAAHHGQAEPADQGSRDGAQSGDRDGSRSTTGVIPGGRGRGKEGERRGNARDAQDPSGSRDGTPMPDPEPPLKCAKHATTHRPPPCGSCGDARREHDAWQRRRRAKPTPTPATPTCPVHPDQPTGSKPCRRCAPQVRAASDGDIASLRETVESVRKSLQ